MPSIFRQAVNHRLTRRTITPSQRDELEAELISREEQHSTAIGNAPAVPHACLDAIHEPVIVFVRLACTVAGTVRKTVILHAPGGVQHDLYFEHCGRWEIATFKWCSGIAGSGCVKWGTSSLSRQRR